LDNQVITKPANLSKPLKAFGGSQPLADGKLPVDVFPIAKQVLSVLKVLFKKEI
jgi:hypothetical protein